MSRSSESATSFPELSHKEVIPMPPRGVRNGLRIIRTQHENFCLLMDPGASSWGPGRPASCFWGPVSINVLLHDSHFRVGPSSHSGLKHTAGTIATTRVLDAGQGPGPASGRRTEAQLPTNAEPGFTEFRGPC